MPITQYDTIFISKHFIPAIINDDTSGLSNDDIFQLNSWLHSNIKPNTCFEVSEEQYDNFYNCQITFKLADCTEVKLFA